MSWAQASLSQTLQSQVLDVFLGDYAEAAMRVEVGQGSSGFAKGEFWLL